MTLADYLDAATKRSWHYGTLDCCTFMADWLVALGFQDPMADRRGQYSTRDEYRDLMRSEGGIVASCSRRFGSIGLRETVSPAAGDVALVLAPAPLGRRVVLVATGSICTGPVMRALVTSDVGLVGAKLETIKVWSIHG
ncbi:DUF6950 family protein [Bradyrhizobium liaoningense]|uniref:DUF6950 family protein n=1 Tax=Bradyrhizobium liaoningense TaxID=43992 RepID=UPI001FCC8429|nr:hypothetical protein [Bradyrhizobium liaoningense]